MKRKVFVWLAIIPAFICVGLISWYALVPKDNAEPVVEYVSPEPLQPEVNEPEESSLSTESEEPTEEPLPSEEPAFQEYDITLMAVGDNLMHMGVVNTGKMEDGTYNYDILFDDITDILDCSDIKIINQETILGGNELGFSGYPRFNSPTEVGDAIVAAGFNVVLSATNHAADQNYVGIENSIHYWETKQEVLFVGVKLDVEDDSIPVLTIKDKTFAILNYTYGPNMETVPKDIRGHLNMLCPYNANGLMDFTHLNPQVLEDIARAKEMADMVIVCPHWGTEYQTKPSSYQKDWALQMAEAGADVIIGTHPHVPQPVEWITAENGNTALCYYSLGNYVSTQKQAICMLEGMASVKFHVTEDDIFVSEESGVLPLVCHYKSGPVRFGDVYALEEYTEELASSHGIWNYGQVPLHLDKLQQWSDEIFGDFTLKRTDLVNPEEVSSNSLSD